MASSVKNMVRTSDDKSSSSSSSDDETLRRCQEAVWESRTVKDKGESDKVKESKRVVVADHEHDGNELQVSQGFRTHVAKKLGNFLDRCISETQTTSSSCVASAKCDDEDEGFRLFSTSVPGQTAEEPPAPVRRRPLPSSSDSDSEMESRLREAAVSVKDLLPSALSPSSTQPPGSGKVKIKKKKNVAEEEEEEEECQIVKKKKKRRPTGEESVQVDCARSLNTKSSGEQQSSEQEHSQVKVKPKKKKKRCEGNTMD
ncbi:protein CUSTOS [Solea solea]|uniref:protein CUSTOS n=1 Tax=Solea solea TaxID=90069 RepID=UPI0027299399|nr:protein CUSTOS [Solea solea]